MVRFDGRASSPWGWNEIPAPAAQATGAQPWDLGHDLTTQSFPPIIPAGQWPMAPAYPPTSSAFDLNPYDDPLGPPSRRRESDFAAQLNPYDDPLGPINSLQPSSTRWNATDPWMIQAGAAMDAPSGATAAQRAYQAEPVARTATGYLDQAKAAARKVAETATKPVREIRENFARASALADVVNQETKAKAAELARGDGKLAHDLQRNGPLDAWRHAEWSRRAASEVGPRTAALAGTGHDAQGIREWLLGDPPSFGKWVSETMMDLHNNQIGRDAASEGKGPFTVTTVAEPDGRFSYRLSDPRLRVIGNGSDPGLPDWPVLSRGLTL